MLIHQTIILQQQEILRSFERVHKKTASVMCIYFSNVSLDVSFSLAAEIVAFRILR